MIAHAQAVDTRPSLSSYAAWVPCPNLSSDAEPAHQHTETAVHMQYDVINLIPQTKKRKCFYMPIIGFH